MDNGRYFFVDKGKVNTVCRMLRKRYPGFEFSVPKGFTTTDRILCTTSSAQGVTDIMVNDINLIIEKFLTRTEEVDR